MKKVIITVATLMMVLLGTLCHAEKSEPTDTSDFVVNGVILKKNRKIEKHCKLELFYENSKIDSTIIKFNKPFECKLKKNVWYTLKVIKDDHIPLLISFNTEINANDTLINNVFAFETELISKEQAKFMDKDLLDFPVGVVAYNKESGKFEARDKYTQKYIIEINKPIKEEVDVAMEFITKRVVSKEMYE